VLLARAGHLRIEEVDVSLHPQEACIKKLVYAVMGEAHRIKAFVRLSFSEKVDCAVMWKGAERTGLYPLQSKMKKIYHNLSEKNLTFSRVSNEILFSRPSQPNAP
jgi:hypothetical protein